MGSNNNYFFKSIFRYVLSFLLVNLFSLLISVIYDRFFAKPNLYLGRVPGGEAPPPPLRMRYYFEFFFEETVIMLLAVFLSIVLSSIIVKRIHQSNFLKPVNKKWFFYFLCLIPIFLFQFSELQVDRNNPSHVYPYIILIIAFYIVMMIYGEIKSINHDKLNGKFHSVYSLMIVRKRVPVIINLIFLLSIYLEIRSTAYYFYLELQRTNVNLHYGILVYSLQILILQLFLSFLISRISKSESFEEISYSVISGRYTKLKKRILILFSVIIVLITGILSYISLAPVTTSTYKYLRNHYFPNIEFINKSPSLSYWFGTDQNGRDIFFIIILSFSSFLFIAYIISLLRFRIVLDFNNITDKTISKSTIIYLTQILGSFPSIPLLSFISMLLLGINYWLLFYLLIFLIETIFSWVHILELMEKNTAVTGKNTFIDKMFHPIILKSIGTILLDLIVLSYLGIFRVNSPSIGSIINDSRDNTPQIYWWIWVFPLLSIIFIIALLRSYNTKN